MVPLRALRSATQLARAGFHSTQDFVHSMQNGALRTPVNLHAEPTGDCLTDFLPRDGHKVLCPLCGDESPDEHHYCSACASTAPIRTDLRAVVANLLSEVEAASFINMELVDSLVHGICPSVFGGRFCIRRSYGLCGDGGCSDSFGGKCERDPCALTTCHHPTQGARADFSAPARALNSGGSSAATQACVPYRHVLGV